MDTKNNIQEDTNKQNTSKNNASSVVGETLSAAKNVAQATGTVVKGTAKTVKGAAKFVNFVFNNLPLVGGIVAALTVGSLFVFNPFGWTLLGGPEIEKTENVVQEVKKISEFTTACYYEESVLKGEKVIEGKEWFGFKTDAVVETIVLTVKCKVRAGFDLSAISDNDLVIVRDSVSIKLPAPKIFDVISNPSDYRIFEESGDWQHEEIVALQVQGKQKMLNNALDCDILEKANVIGRERITALFTALGFRAVNVILTDVPEREQAPVAPAQDGNGPAVELVPAVEIEAAVIEATPVAEVQQAVESVEDAAVYAAQAAVAEPMQE